MDINKATTEVTAKEVECEPVRTAKQVDYTEAHGYFVRNDAPSQPSCYYDSKEAFDSVFGCAAFMGEGGTPTQIDFTRQSVIAVIGCETNRPTKYIPVSLMSQAGTLCLKYNVEEAAPTTSTMVPLLLLVLDKAYASPNIKLEKQSLYNPSNKAEQVTITVKHPIK